MKEFKSVSQLFSANDSRQIRLMCIFAHPDDESILCGSLLARARKEGIYTSVICVTNGSKGHVGDNLNNEELAQLRAKELLVATKILGVKKVIQLHYLDGAVYPQRKKIYRAIKKLVLEIKPSVIITHDPSGLTGHPDHITLSAIVTKICQDKPFPDIQGYYVTLPKFDRLLLKMKSPNNIQIQNMPIATQMFQTKTYLNEKKRALKAHKSQHLMRARSLSPDLRLSTQAYEYFHRINSTKKYQFLLRAYCGAGFTFTPKTPVVRVSSRSL